MPWFKWSEIPECRREMILEQERAAQARGMARDEFFTPPENFDPVYEARELVVEDYGHWRFEFDDNYKKFLKAPKPILFGSGHGYHKIPEAFRPDEPLDLKFLGVVPEGYKNKRRVPEVAEIGGQLLFSDRAFSIVRRFEDIPEDRHLTVQLWVRKSDHPVPYHFFDLVPLSEDDIDYDRSDMLWFRPKGWCLGEEKNVRWGGAPVPFGSAFQPHVRFHLRRGPTFIHYLISKDLLHTLYEAGIDLVPERYDPHAEKYGHQYSPRNVL